MASPIMALLGFIFHLSMKFFLRARVERHAIMSI